MMSWVMEKKANGWIEMKLHAAERRHHNLFPIRLSAGLIARLYEELLKASVLFHRILDTTA